MATYQIRSGDTITMDPSILSKRDGTAAVITGATVRLQADDFSGTSVMDVAATVSDGPNGKVIYTFVAGDFGAAKLLKSTYRCRWKVTYSGGAIETFPTVPNDLLLAVY